MKNAIKYKREFGRSYMSVEADESLNINDYVLKRLVQGNIPALLKTESELVDDRLSLLYDISGLQAFSHIYGSEKIGFKDLCSFLESLEFLTDCLEENLLTVDSVIFSPDAIFTDYSRKRWYFCCFPDSDQSIRAEITEFFTELLSVVNYEEPQAVALCFSLHKVAQGENFSVHDLLTAASTVINETASEGTSAGRIHSFDGTICSENDSSYPREDVRDKGVPDTDTDEIYGFGNNISHISKKENGKGSVRIFMQKAKKYFSEKDAGEIYDDINSGTIFKKIRSVCCNGHNEYDISGNDRSPGGSLGGSHLGSSGGRLDVSRCENPRSNLGGSLNGSHLDSPGSSMDETSFGYDMRSDIPGRQFSYLNERTDAYAPQDDIENTKPLDIAGTNIMFLEGENSTSGITIVIDRMPFTIGKDGEACDYRLDHPSVSRIHCRILDDPGVGAVIEDINSTNSTYVNGYQLKPYEKHAINAGDKIRIAELEFLFK